MKDEMEEHYRELKANDDGLRRDLSTFLSEKVCRLFMKSILYIILIFKLLKITIECSKKSQ